MAQNHQTFDTRDASEPGAEALDGVMVDGAITGERGDGSRNEAA
jgi:hypothetical protein